MHLKYLLIVLCIFPHALNTAHILSVFGAPGRSQYAFIEPLLKELARRGHRITSITNFPQKENVTNFRDVVVEKNINLFNGELKLSYSLSKSKVLFFNRFPEFYLGEY